MASGNDIFFIDSSASEDNSDNNNNDSSYNELHGREMEEGPAYHPLFSSPTMEDVLFGLAPPKCRPPTSPASSSFAQQQNGSDRNSQATLERSTTGTSSAGVNGDNGAHPQQTRRADFPYAGRSPCAMPTKQLIPPSRTLTELRAMTSSDVREELEMFFVRKEALAKRFKAIEEELFPQKTEKATLLSSSLSPSSPTSAVATSTEVLLARDRCRRLVNISNWDSAVNGYSHRDVLLPSSLLPDAVPATSPALGNRRTLRPHQIEGIRFLWSNLVEGPVGQVPAVGCILAHTMGLGKTGQVVVFLHLFMAAFQRRVESNSSSSSSGNRSALTSPPHSSAAARLPRVLIVFPKSTQSGWKHEFQAWSRCFPEEYRLHPCVIEEGSRPHQRIGLFRQWRRDGGVLMIGYEAFVRLIQLVNRDSVWLLRHGRDSDACYASSPTISGLPSEPPSAAVAREHHRRVLRERHIDEGGQASGGDADPFTELVVCDEAHRLKSVHLHVVQALRGLHPLRRLLLTGTPLQNHLHEYWAMMDFCVHKYFSRRRFREYFIEPIESSASTRASDKEVDLARKKTFTLINEVRHFVQRVDSAPLRNELPPLHEYVVVLPPSPLQRELYLRFIQILQHDGTQKLQFLPAVSYSGKIAAHPQLLFQMRDQLDEKASNTSNNDNDNRRVAGNRGGGSSRSAPSTRRVNDYWGLERRRQDATAASSQQARHQQKLLPVQPLGKRKRFSDDDAEEAQSEGGSDEAVVISDSSSSSSSSSNSENVRAEEDEEFVRVTQQSFSALHPAPLTYEELCIPPTPTYVPRLEEGVKMYVAMKLIAAAMAQNEKVLLFSLSTQLLTFFESMIAEVNVEWCKKSGECAMVAPPALLPRPIRYCRLDGSRTAAQRAATLEEFNRAEGPDLFMLSMKAGGVGVTITAATRIILVDTSFNPADDQQAIGRAYRYGQTRPVFVYRLMCYPTLEYSIFVQKLAKEWLFKTVVEEASVKRDGLSGMHLKELFSLLTKVAKVLQKPPSATRAQTQATIEVLQDDPMLRVVQTELLYAQRYEMFLEQDNNDQYGAEEEEFYKDYCRNRLFDTADDDSAERRRAADILQRRQQRMDEAAQLQSQSKTLTSMVEDLIRSRAGTDPHLAQLLTAMGLRVDSASGQVQTSKNSTSSSRNERFAPSPVLLVGGSNPSPPPLQSSANRTAMAGSAADGLQPPRSPSIHNSHQTAVLLLDSDNEESSVALPPGEAGNGEKQQQQKNGESKDVLKPVSTADRIGTSLARQPYARYRPGVSPSCAVEIDSDASQ